MCSPSGGGKTNFPAIFFLSSCNFPQEILHRSLCHPVCFLTSPQFQFRLPHHDQRPRSSPPVLSSDHGPSTAPSPSFLTTIPSPYLTIAPHHHSGTIVFKILYKLPLGGFEFYSHIERKPVILESQNELKNLKEDLYTDRKGYCILFYCRS